MQITITGGIMFGPSWAAMQRLIVSMLNQDGRLTRITRRDGGVNYRDQTGVYDLTFTPDTGDETRIVLTVN